MIVLCHGSDAFRIRTSADAEARATGVLPVRLRMTDADARTELERILKYPSFLQEHRTVILSDALADDTLPGLLEDAGAPSLSDTTVIACAALAAKPTADARARLAALARLSVRTHECNPLEGRAREAWVRELCAENAWNIEASAVPALLARVGDDSWALATELEKLAAFGNGTITVDAVLALTPDPAARDQWELSNAIAAHDKRRALRALFDRVREGAPEPLLLGSLASSIRTLMMIRDLSDRGKNAAAIAAVTGLHPFVVSKTISGARAYDVAGLRRALAGLAELDGASKRGDADAVDGMFGVLLGLT